VAVLLNPKGISEKRSERDGFCFEKRKRTSGTLSITGAKDARAVVL
jgi:hypothetical protein